MATRGPLRKFRRWRRRQHTHAPRTWADGLATLGVLLLTLGAIFVAIYVSGLH